MTTVNVTVFLNLSRIRELLDSKLSGVGFGVLS